MVNLSRRYFNRGLLVVLGCLLILFFHFFSLYNNTKSYNQYVNSSESLDVALASDEKRILTAEQWFINATTLARGGYYEKAAEAYAQSSRLADSELLVFIYYNLGNLYLKQAISQAEKLGIDSAMAFTDAAKSFYRRSLRLSPSFLQAKYNYETAQRLVRDLPLNESKSGTEEEEVPEDLWSAMPGFPIGLP